MVYRRGWVNILYKYKLEKILKEGGIENYNQVATFLCGDEEDPEYYKYQVVDRTRWTAKETKLYQRLNRLWFVPLYFLTIPFQWLFRGHVGFESTSKAAAIMSKWTGLE